MKRTAVLLALTFWTFLCTATLLHAAEQKTIFNTESIENKSGTSPKKCQDMCSRRSGPDATSLLSEGWKIVNSFPKKVIAEDYWYIPCNTCKPHGCTCIGTEYTLQKDAPARKVEIPNIERKAPDKNTQTGRNAPKAEASDNEPDLLKKENDLLKQENTELKQQIKELKNQMKLQH